MILYCKKPELGTFDDKGAFVKGKCSFAVRAQLQAKTGKVRSPTLYRAFCPMPLALLSTTHPTLSYALSPLPGQHRRRPRPR